ncbi:MAG: hypothetical protein ACRCUJ_06345 [Phocaeicola sp.]
MMKRIATIILGIVVLLVAVQPKLVVHLCGNHFVALYLNQAPATLAPGCAQANHCTPFIGTDTQQLATNEQLTTNKSITQQLSLAIDEQSMAGKRSTIGNQLTVGEESPTFDNSSKECPQRQLVVVDVDADDFTPLQLQTYSFSLEQHAVMLFLPVVTRYLIPQQTVLHLLCGKAPPYSPISLTGRDILLRHTTLLI